MKVEIFYEYTRRGRKEQAAVTTEAGSVAAATNSFKNKFAGKFDRVISSREVKKPPRA